MKIKSRLIIMSIAFFIGLIVISGMLFYQLYINDQYNNLIAAMKDLKANVYETNLQLDRMLFGSELVEEHAAFQHTYQKMRSAMDHFFQLNIYQNLSEKNKSVLNDTATLKNMFLMNDDKIVELLKVVQILDEQYPTYLPGLFEASVYYNNSLLQSTLDSIEILSTNFSRGVSRQLDTIVENMKGTVLRYEQHSRVIVIAVVCVIVVFVSLMSFTTITQLRKRISSLESDMQRLETGNLSRLLAEDGKDEIGQISKSINNFLVLFCQMIGHIQTLSERTKRQKIEVDTTSAASVNAIRDIRRRVNGLNEKYKQMIEHLQETESASAVIKENLDTFVENMENQSSAVNQSTASIEEMNASIESVVEITQKRKAASAQMVKVTELGGLKVEHNSGLIEENAQDAKEVEDIIALIDDIAGQTSLLAMNAAIEAVHAGDAGRGFSVVAREIRKFAESTNGNSRRIGSAMQNIVKRIESIFNGSNELLKIFAQIISETRSFNDSLSEISGSIQEISLGSNEIMAAMNALNTAAVQIQDRTGDIQTRIGDISGAIRNVYFIGSGINLEIDELDREMHGIEELIEKVNTLNSENSRIIHVLNTEMEKFILSDEHASFIE
ncbi:HAMP domain-containing methyl-accepting chemotaxis protein [Marispirochaeta aestuarii]|uniref:methyl-accepting chemotaxis protein n=1 Tax=Marispirochaeta aestuarii TaxID=1963862 RepID=UPI002ABDA47F|nr:HAMP domain-containing methyl-accepting chemotaxis protein [Marispirochaeta aestuarii]